MERVLWVWGLAWLHAGCSAESSPARSVTADSSGASATAVPSTSGAIRDASAPSAPGAVDAGHKALWAERDLACAIVAGEVWCWGENEDHLLGGADVTKPIRVSALDGAVGIDFASFGPGPRRGYALLGDGTIRVFDKRGVTALPHAKDVIDFATTYFVACVVVKGGAVQCVEPDPKVAPLPLPKLSGVQAIVGSDGSGFCAIDDKAVTCWEYKNGSSSLELQPARVVSDVAGVKQVAITSGSACARTGTGEIWCWREGGKQRWKVSFSEKAVQIGTDEDQVCAILESGKVGCRHYNRETGVAHETFEITGVSGATQMQLGGGFGCVRARAGKVHCWGKSDRGEFGDGVPDDDAKTTTNAVVVPIGM